MAWYDPKKPKTDFSGLDSLWDFKQPSLPKQPPSGLPSWGTFGQKTPVTTPPPATAMPVTTAGQGVPANAPRPLVPPGTRWGGMNASTGKVVSPWDNVSAAPQEGVDTPDVPDKPIDPPDDLGEYWGMWAGDGNYYLVNKRTGETKQTNLPPRIPKPPVVKPSVTDSKNFTDPETGYIETWAVDADGNRIGERPTRVTPPAKPAERSPAKWAVDTTSVPGWERIYALDESGKEIQELSRWAKAEKKPEPQPWQWKPVTKKGTNEPVTRGVPSRYNLESGNPIPAGATLAPGEFTQVQQTGINPATGETRVEWGFTPGGDYQTLYDKLRDQPDMTPKWDYRTNQLLSGTEWAARSQNKDTAPVGAEAWQEGMRRQNEANIAQANVQPRNWIRIQEGNKQPINTPPVIARLTGQVPGQPMKKLPVMRPSTQDWNAMLDADKEMLMGYLEWIGINPQQWMAEQLQAWQGGGQGTTGRVNWRPAYQPV